MTQRVIVLRRTHGAALERDDLQPGLGQLFGENAAGPAKTNDDDVDFREPGYHDARPQLMSAMLSGLAENGLSRQCATSSRWTAMIPGKPMMAHPALLRLPP